MSNTISNTDEYFQMQVQRSSEELFDEINKLKTPKDFLQFSSFLIKSLNVISIEDRESFSHEKIIKHSKKKNYIFLNDDKIIFHIFLFQFFEKQKIFFNPCTQKNFNEKHLEKIKKFIKDEKFKKLIEYELNDASIDKSKNFLLLNFHLKECIENEFQNLLHECKFESIYLHSCNSYEFISKKLQFLKYLICSYYFINVFHCSQKLMSMIQTVKTLILQNNEEFNEYLEYQIELLQLIHDFIVQMDTFLTIGIMENVNPDVCIDHLQN